MIYKKFRFFMYLCLIQIFVSNLFLLGMKSSKKSELSVCCWSASEQKKLEPQATPAPIIVYTQSESNFIDSIFKVFDQISKRYAIVDERSTTVHENDSYVKQLKFWYSLFCSRSIPSIAVIDYLNRIKTCFNCSPKCYAAAAIYIDRFILKLNRFNVENVLNPKYVHRVFLVAILVAVKYYDDIFFKNKFYANVGGVSVEELNALELGFLGIISFDLYISEQDFCAYDSCFEAMNVGEVPV